MEFFRNHPLKEYNSFGIDTKALSFFSFETEEELIRFSDKNISETTIYQILGGGSNVLFTNDYPGLIIHSRIEDIMIIKEANDYVIVRVGSGLEWDSFVAYCVENSYYGIENLSLIPGNVGAAPVQNIGAYGTEVNEVIEGVLGYNLKAKEKFYLTNKECDFSYRNSVFKTPTHKSYIITYVDFKLFKRATYEREIANSKGSILTRYFKHYKNLGKDFYKALRTIKIDFKRKSISVEYRLLKKLLENSGIMTLKKVRKTIIEKRNSKIPNPNEIGNVGSFFKNPIVSVEKANQIKSRYQDVVTYPLNLEEVKISAGWLIKKVEWASKLNDKVGLYKDQTLIIVNKGNATGKEIFDYSEEIVNAVYKKFQIKLEREVVVI